MLANEVIAFVIQSRACLFINLEETSNLITIYSDHSHETLCLSSSEAYYLLSFLSLLLEDKKIKIIFYNCKNLYSLAFKQAKDNALDLSCLDINLSSCQDLFYRERFCGLTLVAPKSIREMANRIKGLSEESKIMNLKIHLPLATQVIPDVENTPLLNIENGQLVYPYYEIEGQVNGRMSANGSKGYNPHILSKEEVKKLSHKGYDRDFIVCDYNALELRILAYITNDEKLLNDTSENDPYLACWKRLFPEDSMNSDTRKVAKSLFLPHFYGKSYLAMARDLKLADDLAEKIFHTINTTYSKAADYLLKSDEKAKINNWQDCLGRKRNFEFSYQARNAEIQGPAAIFCQEHLIKLHQAIKNIGKLHASIHDGFIVSCKKEMSEEVKDVVQSTLESKSEILQNLSVPVSSDRNQVLCNIL